MTLEIDFIVLTRNRPDALEQCLTFLSNEIDGNSSCIVIDNSDESIRGEIARCCKKHAWVRYQWMPSSPYILSAGRNAGVKMASSDIVAFLDDDSYISEGWVSACRESFKDSNVGAVGGPIDDPEVTDFDHKRQCQIGTFDKNGDVIDNFDCKPEKPIEIEHMRGCNWAIRRCVFDECGGFDETLSGYCFEELDLSLKIRSQSHQILFHPHLQIYHDLKPRIGGEKPKPFRMFEITRNLSRIYCRYDGKLCCSYLRFLLFYKTGLIALLKKPSYDNLLSAIYTMRGKLNGLITG